MRINHLAYLLFATGIIIMFIAVITGEANIALFLIFPVIYGSGALTLVATIFIMLGIFLFFLSPFYHYTREEPSYLEPANYNEPYNEPYTPTNQNITQEEKKTKIGGVVLIGPIPIVFGSDKQTAMLSVMIAILMLISIGIILMFIYG